jgi:Carboxypeptidase regulatory-like domain
MRRFATLAFVSFFVIGAPSANADVLVPPVLQILGNVTNSARPVANALVIALNLKDLATSQTYSSTDGTFTLPSLPTGIYKIIAVKQGFAPAIATVIPTRPNQRVKLSLEDEKKAKAKAKSDDDMWEVRASLPPDILHQIDMVLASSSLHESQLPRFAGEMVSLTGVGDQAATPGFAKTSVGVQSRLGDTWQLGVHGNIHRIDDPTEDSSFGPAAAQSSVMSIELRSSPTDVYRVASTKSFWRYRNDSPSSSEADVRSHNIEWEHGDARVRVRYFAQENLFASNPSGSDLLEVTGGTTLMHTRRNDLGVSLRVTQENVRNTPQSILRTADVTTNGSVSLVPSLIVKYGLSSRAGVEGTELGPRAGAEWKLTKETALVASAMVKTYNSTRAVALPSVVVWTEDARNLPKYTYSVGIVSGDENASRLSAVATITAVDTPMRVIVSDGYEQFWDGLYVDSGDIRHDLRVSYRKDLGHKLAIDVSTSAGTASAVRGGAAKSYIASEVQSIFFPTGTTLLLTYREIEQPQANHSGYHSERVSVRMAQSLHLPIDLKLLLGIELARADNSPFLLDTLEANGAARKYIGGLAVNF